MNQLKVKLRKRFHMFHRPSVCPNTVENVFNMLYYAEMLNQAD